MTRQWLADPELMCVPHRNAEHAETHMFLEKMFKGTSLKGFYEGSMFFGPSYLVRRHDLLTQYLPNHSTPIFVPLSLREKYENKFPEYEDYSDSIITLMDRCENCREKMVERLAFHGEVNLDKP